MSVDVQSRTNLATGDRWTEVTVGCDVRLKGACRSVYTTVMRKDETEAEAKRRAVGNALAGRWVKVGRVLYCPPCAVMSGRGTK